MRATLLALLLCNPCLAQNRPVDARLAEMVEQVVAKTKINIGVSRLEDTSVNISKVNGRDVCSPEALEDVKRLQAAFIEHPSIYQSYSIYTISITNLDGSRTQTEFSDLRKKGVFTSDCINIFASVRP